MTTISSQDGSFSLTKIPVGTYVVVYAKGKDVDPKSWEGIVVNYGIIPAKPDTKPGDEIPDPFGGSKGFRGEGALVTLYDKELRVVGWIMEEGAVRSNAYGLTLEFVDRNAATVQVQGSKTIEIEIRVSMIE